MVYKELRNANERITRYKKEIKDQQELLRNIAT